MEQETLKLQKVKKSCGTVKKIAKILMIISIVATILGVIAFGMTIALHGELNDRLVELNAMGKIEMSNNYTKAVTGVFFPGELSMAMLLAIYTLECSVIMGALSVVMHLISSAFGIIERSSSPFTDEAIKKFIIAMILISVITFIFGSPVYGILLGVITWAIYTILDYGRVLQIQSDETL